MCWKSGPRKSTTITEMVYCIIVLIYVIRDPRLKEIILKHFKIGLYIRSCQGDGLRKCSICGFLI